MGLIYLDACLLIYAIENHPVWAGEVKAALASEPSDSFALDAAGAETTPVLPKSEIAGRILDRLEALLAAASPTVAR